MKVDGHAHLWKPAEGFDIKPLRDTPFFAMRDWLPEHVRPDLDALGIDKLIVTQSAPQIEETQSMLAHCRDLDFVAGVVGWADLRSAAGVEDIATLAHDPKFRGLRLQLRRMPDDDYIRCSTVQAGVDELARRELVAVLLAEERHHEACLAVLRDRPTGRVVLNHAGMPDIVNGDLDLWARTMRRYARETDVVTQLSGLVALAGPHWTIDAIRPLAFTLIEIFGPDRIMFASDWPLSVPLGADYRRWYDIVQLMFDELGLAQAERSAILGGVAARVYQIAE